MQTVTRNLKVGDNFSCFLCIHGIYLEEFRLCSLLLQQPILGLRIRNWQQGCSALSGVSWLLSFGSTAFLVAMKQAVDKDVDTNPDHKIMVGHWFRPKKLLAQTTLTMYGQKHVRTYWWPLPNIIQYPFTFQLEHATCVGYILCACWTRYIAMKEFEELRLRKA